MNAAPAINRLAVRQVWPGSLIVLGISAGMTAVIAATHAGVTADPAAAAGLRNIAGNPAIRTLFGNPVALDHAGGFTVWRAGTPVAILLGTWAILTVTRITRGAEEAGRWDLLLAGRVALRTLTARHLTVVAAVAVLTGAAVTAALSLTADRPFGALLHGAGIGLIGLFSAATAALAAQLFAARATASGAAVGVLGGALLLRMAGDGVTGLAWLRWLSRSGSSRSVHRTARTAYCRWWCCCWSPQVRVPRHCGSPDDATPPAVCSPPAPAAGRTGGCSAGCTRSPYAACCCPCWPGPPACSPTSC